MMDHPPKPAAPKERLSKIMAARGLCSRREADHLIQAGWVLVDGHKITVLGSKIYAQQNISLLPAAQRQLHKNVTILLNKPVGYVSGQPEKGYLPAVQLITPETQFRAPASNLNFHPTQLQHLAPAGRLDIDSQGLLVLTQDGRIARQLIGANSRLEKEYIVRVTGNITATRIQQLTHGLVLDEKRLRPAKIKHLYPDVLQIILTEGRKRQIRRMCHGVGLEVTKLKRVRIGRVKLGALPPGKWRYLSSNESF